MDQLGRRGRQQQPALVASKVDLYQTKVYGSCMSYCALQVEVVTTDSTHPVVNQTTNYHLGLHKTSTISYKMTVRGATTIDIEAVHNH